PRVYRSALGSTIVFDFTSLKCNFTLCIKVETATLLGLIFGHPALGHDRLAAYKVRSATACGAVAIDIDLAEHCRGGDYIEAAAKFSHATGNVNVEDLHRLLSLNRQTAPGAFRIEDRFVCLRVRILPITVHHAALGRRRLTITTLD